MHQSTLPLLIMSSPRTFSIFTLGCKVNQYETEQLAALLRSRGLHQAAPDEQADLRIVNTCSVTTEAGTKSRQAVRRATRRGVPENSGPEHRAHRVLVTGCWATSDKGEAQKLPGVDAVLTHHDDVAAELDQLLRRWAQESCGDKGSIIAADCTPGARFVQLRVNKPHDRAPVKRNLESSNGIVGTRSLPLLGERQSSHQRAFLKIQDGCDAHCTYCIIPQLRPALWNKPIDDTVEETRRLVEAGHREIVLTGIFLGAYGQSTALRRRQSHDTGKPLGELVQALCTRVPGLRRLRLSSLEPGDLTSGLIALLKSHPQVVPHFHLPLQSGSDRILRRMNRQYTRQQFVDMVEMVRASFDRPALTTDIIVAFPGEIDHDFEQTLEVVEAARFIHIHAFPFSARPGTAAARWDREFVPSTIASGRIQVLEARAAQHSLAFREKFVGQTLELIVERQSQPSPTQHGRCDRYFDVHFDHAEPLCGRIVRARIDRVTPTRTHGTLLSIT
jgi:threonylcarbamoyladenosine tRNA methylthiotransferase MtaB